MSKRILVSLSPGQRQQVDALVAKKKYATINQAIRAGLDFIIYREKITRWDNQLFEEYESGMLKRHPRTGVLLSVGFQKNLNQLVKEKERSLRRGVWVTLRKLAQNDNKCFRINPMMIADYYFLRFTFKGKDWRIIFRRWKKEIIACRLMPADQAWSEWN